MPTWKQLYDNPKLKAIYDTRLSIIKATRDFFYMKNFIEVETPIAVRYVGQEPHLNPIPLAVKNEFDVEKKFYLQTSPEYAMKKLLAVGYERIFQICKCFRNNERQGSLHNTEFTMLEWYRTGSELDKIMDDCEGLFNYIAKNVNGLNLADDGNSIDLTLPWDRISMKDLWNQTLNVNLDDFFDLDKFINYAHEKGYAADDFDKYEDLFHKIFLNEIEPKLGWKKPIFIYDYPTTMCSLSKPCENDPRYANRFELYIKGIELANAFGELTDADRQEKNFLRDQKQRKQSQKEIFPIDQELLSALQKIKKGASGIALGLDRMVLLLTNSSDLNDVIFESISDQLNN
ncbi:MAG: EF-P lysine aminoacylase EpmA [bacterium]